MSDRTAASAGFTAAGIAFAATFLPWPAGRIPATVFAAFGFVVFGLRRYGIVDRAVSAPLGGFAGVALAFAGLYGLFAPAVGGGAAGISAGPALASVVGVLVAVSAYADWVAIPRDELGRMASATVVATAVGVSGLLAIVAWGSVIASLVRAAAGGEISPSIGTVLSAVALGLGTGSVAVLYLRAGGRDRGFIDLGWPDLRDGAYVVGGVIAIVGLNVAIGLLFQQLGLESARHSVIRTAESNPEILLVLIPLSYLIIGPGEELLYRNIVQKSLYGVFSRPAAVVIASAVFAAVHVFAFSNPDGSALGTLNTLAVVFVLALVLGAVYERTGNVVVPAVIHGTFNAIAFAVTYVQITGAIP